MGRIWLKNIEQSLRGMRMFLSLAGLGVIFKARLPYISIITANNFLALFLLAYSIYHYIYQIEKVSNIVHHAILIIDVCVAFVVGYFSQDDFEILLGGK